MAFAMSEEERKRQALANYALQQGNINLRVQDIPKAPSVTVTDQPQKYSVKVGPSMQVEPIKVSTPYSVRNFLSSQPQSKPKNIFQGAVDFTLGKNQPNDNRSAVGKIIDQLNTLDNGKSFRQNTPTSSDSLLTQYRKQATGPILAMPLRSARTAVGLAQGASGIYDLATPGKGTNRLSQNLDKAAKKLDQTATEVGGKTTYNVLGPAQEIALYAASGGTLAGAKAASSAGKTGVFAKIGSILNKIDKPAAKLAGKGKFGKAVSGGIVTPEILPDIAGTVKYIGEDASKGKEITPERLLVDATTGVLGGIAGSAVNNSLERIFRKEIIDKFVKETDAKKIEDVIRKNNVGVPENDIQIVSENIAKSTDPEEIKNILNGTLSKNTTTVPEQQTTAQQTQDITDTVVTELSKTKTPQEVTDAVDALFPTLPKEEKLNLTNKIAQTQDVNQIKQLVEEAKARETQLEETVQVNTPEQVATTQAEQTQQALEEAIPAPKPAPEPSQAPITQEPTTSSPKSIEGSQTADNVPGATAPKTDPLEALKQEARKYKSAEEFVNSKANAFHGSDSVFDEMQVGRPTKRRLMFGEYDTTSEGMFFAPDEKVAREFGENVGKYYVDVKKPLVFSDRANDNFFNEFDKSIENVKGIDIKPGESGFSEWMYLDGELGKRFKKFAKSKGFDGAKIDEVSEFTGDDFATTVAFDNDQVKSVKQLTDLYNQATAPKTVEKTADTVPLGTVGAVPGAQQTATQTPVEQTVQNIVDANEQIANTYNPGVFGKIKNFARSQWDPRTEANKLDREYEKITGAKLTADEKLGEAIRASNNSANTSAQFIKDSPEYINVIKKYRPNTKASEEFNYYRVAMLDLERRANGRQPIFDLPTEQLMSDVKQLEAKYPGIRNDLISLSQGYVRRLQELAVNGPDAFVSADDFARVALKKDGTPFIYYTPIQRKMPEGVARPEITAKNVGNISRQQVLQELDKTGNDVDLTYDSLQRYSDVVHKQLGQAKVARILGQRVEQGIGGKFIQTADEFARLKAYKQNLQELRDVSKSLDKTIGKLKVKAKYAGNEAKQATAQAVSRAKQLLKQSISDDVDAQAAIDNLSDKDLTDVLKLAAEPDIKNTPNVRRIYNRFAKKSAAHARILEDLDYARMDAEALDSVENGIRSEIAELAPDPTTGKQIIRGLDGEGNKFTIEVPPEMAKLLQGLEWKGGNITKTGRILTAPLRMAWTGILNPAFIVKSAIWNTAMVPITSSRGFKIYSPSAIKAGFSALNNDTEFQKMLTRNAANRYGSDFNKLTSDSITEAIAGNADLASKMRFYNPFTPKGFARNWGKLNEIGGKVDAIFRSSAAKAEYDYVIKNGGTVQQAEKAASEAYSTVLPDYGNVSQQIKAIDAWIPYTAAGAAGTRTFFRAIKNNPKKNAAILGAYASLGVGIAAYSMSHNQGQEFYKDMEKSGKLSSLDGYAVVVLPGAHKDEKTGEWNGVIKIPVPPELRAVNRAIRETIAIVSTEKSVDPKMYARAVFDFMTGGAFTQPKAPVIDMTASMLSGTNVSTGAPIREPNATTKEKILQNFDYLSGQFGLAGKIANEASGRGNGDNVATILTDSFKTMFYGAKGEKDTQKYFRYKNEALNEIKLNANQLGVFNSVISPRSKDLEGRDIKDKSFYDTSAKAQAWLKDITAGDGKLWEVSKRIAQKQKAEGKPIDPLYELDGDQLKIVLGMMANPSPGNYEEKAIQKLNPWVKDFYKKRSEYFDTIFGGEATKDYNGVEVPKADKSLQAKINSLDTMDKAQKAQFLKDNTDITDYFTAQTAYQRYKRDIMGLPQFDQYPTASPEVQKYMDTYNSLPKGNGPIGKTTGKPTSPDRSAWIKSHPNEWAAMTEQWYKQNLYNLQGDAALAVYEGIELDKDALSNIDKIAEYRNKLASGTNGYGRYSKFGYNYAPKEAVFKVSNLLGGIQPGDIKQSSIVKTTPNKVKFKAQKPSGKSRTTKRLRLQ